MEALYNLLLGLFSIGGSVRFAQWLIKRKKTEWWQKGLGLVFAGFMLVAGLDLMSGAPATDLRILSEIFGTAGAVIAAQWLFTRPSIRANNWAQAGVALFFICFLTVTWWEQIDAVRSGTFVVPTSISAPVSSAPSSVSTASQLCFTTPPPPPEDARILGCP